MLSNFICCHILFQVLPRLLLYLIFSRQGRYILSNLNLAPNLGRTVRVIFSETISLDLIYKGITIRFEMPLLSTYNPIE